MPMLDKEQVQLLVAGNAHGFWESYEVDSDLLTPADGWHVSLGMSNGTVPASIKAGASVKILVGGELVLTGYIDEINHSVSKGHHSLTISGRDLAADLVDCSAPVFSANLVSLEQAASKIVSVFNLGKPLISADSTRTREKICIEPGDSAWDALARVAEANGLWPWFEPDGTLVIGGPDYSTPVVATLILRKNGKGNNVLNLDKHESMNGRHSEVTVYGQSPGTHTEQGRNNLHSTWADSAVSRHRPKIVVDHECDTPAVCRDRARKLVAESRLNGLTLSATVKGHRISAPGQASDGQLWKPAQRVRVISEPHEIDDVFFMMGRKFKRNRSDGTRTVLTLKEDGQWLLDAHPHKNKHRRGKNDPGQIIVVSGAAT